MESDRVQSPYVYFVPTVFDCRGPIGVRIVRRYETGHVHFRTTFSETLVSGEISTCRRQTIDLLNNVSGLFDGFARSPDGGFDDAVSAVRRSLETCTKRLGKRVHGLDDFRAFFARRV